MMGSGMMDGGLMGMGGWGGMFLGTLIWVGLLLLLGLGIAALIRNLWGRPASVAPSESAPQQEDPLAILQARLARGDIDPEDYAARKRILMGEKGTGK